MRSILGINIDDSLLPLSNMNGAYFPFMLDTGKECLQSRRILPIHRLLCHWSASTAGRSSLLAGILGNNSPW